jgi:RNA polymerase sigma-70 factor (ECF subfamily)
MSSEKKAQRIGRGRLSYRLKRSRMVDLADEQAWIVKSQQGDLEAFEKLIARYQRMIHSVAFRMTNSIPDSEELAQETFIQAFQHLGSFRHESKFSSWLYRIALNACLNSKKRSQRREQAHQEWGLRHKTENLGTEPEIPEGQTEAVQAALLKLPAKQRAAIILTIYEGLTHAATAKILGCSETTISWRLFRARKQLKRSLEMLLKKSA